MKRQLLDCRAEAERRGWHVAEEYVDDDLSAYSEKKRPAYKRMLLDIAEGRRDGVIVWHMDRLHRRPIELERFVATCTRAGVGDVVTLSGDIDLAKGDGLLMARLLAAVAANESDSKRRRQQRKALEIAQADKPKTGGPRPFGFEDDKTTHKADEVAVIRDLAARALAGETLASMATWLQANYVQTVGGKEWRTNTVRAMLTNPRNWGLRTHQGQVIGPANWKPIIEQDQGERLRLLLLDPARRTNRSARRYLLTGLLICGICGTRLNSAPRGDIRRYGCKKGPDSRGCGSIFIYAAMLEDFIQDAVLYRLDSPSVHEALTDGSADQEKARTIAEAIQKDIHRMDELATMWADGEISRPEWLQARNRIEKNLEANRRSFARLTHRDAVADYIGHGKELRNQWNGLNLSRQVAIVKAVLNHVTILPATTPGRRGLDPSRVVPEWRQ